VQAKLSPVGVDQVPEGVLVACAGAREQVVGHGRLPV
jgi:hypothetical protein